MTSIASTHTLDRIARNGSRPLRPPGMVGVVAQDTARFSFFAASLTGVEVPDGTTIKWMIGHGIAAQVNDLVRAMLATDAEWLWVMGDDHVFGPAILNRLLDRDVDVVVPLCLSRFYPYKPVICSGMDAATLRRQQVVLDDHPGGGLIEVHSAGSAGMLIRRHVLEAMDDPWFEAGQLASVEIGEDFYFCDKARAAGFRVYADLDTPLGHVTTATVWPSRGDDGWTYGFGFAGGFTITMPGQPWDGREQEGAPDG